mmetsp:Transcript_4070/g.7022  ORF Transcript_4070/g.7022 Transcript_4070/m.7022 type:complete len:301 (+) Transcript_4070:387-1289(+)
MRNLFAPKQFSDFPSYTKGDTIVSKAIGVVCLSKDPNMAVGTYVIGLLPWADYCMKTSDEVMRVEERYVSQIGKTVREGKHFGQEKLLSLIDSSTMSAYLPLKYMMAPLEGQTAYVSGAAGSVGLMVCQLLKHKYGCRVVGSAGTDVKVDLLLSLGIDYAFNYKEISVTDALKQYSPSGIDFYWDNVGGKTLDDMLPLMKKKGKIVCCGQISQYNGTNVHPIKNTFEIVVKSLRIQGFMLDSFMEDFAAHVPESRQEIFEMWLQNKLQTRETIYKGIECLPQAFIDMFAGKNIGKMLVEI